MPQSPYVLVWIWDVLNPHFSAWSRGRRSGLTARKKKSPGIKPGPLKVNSSPGSSCSLNLLVLFACRWWQYLTVLPPCLPLSSGLRKLWAQCSIPSSKWCLFGRWPQRLENLTNALMSLSLTFVSFCLWKGSPPSIHHDFPCRRVLLCLRSNRVLLLRLLRAEVFSEVFGVYHRSLHLFHLVMGIRML